MNTASNVTYLHSTAHLFGNDADTIQVQVNDNGNTGSGGGTDINFGTVNVDITAVNDPSVVTGTGGTLTYTENDSATAVDPGLTVSDVDSANLSLAWVWFGANYANGQDLLGFTDQNGITGSWDAGSGILTLSGSATVAQYQTALRSVTYVNTSDAPSTATRLVQFAVNDGIDGSNVGSRNVEVIAVNDPPAVTGIEGSPVAYSENDGAVAVTSTIAFTDVDDTHIESAVVQISGGYQSGEDVLSFTNQNGITGVYNSGSGTWTLTGSATLAQYETAIRSITYTNTSENPNTTTRTVSFTVNDGDDNSNTVTRDITLGSVNDDPTNAGGLPTDITVTEDVASNVDLSAIDLSDLDASSGSLTVKLTTATGGNLTAAAGTGITFGGNGTGALTLTGTQADLNAYLNTASNVTYLHSTAHLFGNDADTIEVLVNDNGNTGSGGGSDQNLGTVNVDITAVNDEEVLATNTGVTVAEGSTGNVVTTAMLHTTDVDNTPGQITYTLTSVPTNGFLRRSGVNLSVSSTFTQADIDAGIITYAHNDTETTSDSFAFDVDDGFGSNSSGSFSITVTPVNDNAATTISDIDGSADVVLENASIGTTIGVTAFADDADAGDTITYSLDDNDGGRFAIDSSTGIVTVAAGIDREADGANRNITVRATSSDSSFQTRVFSITINDVDEFDVGAVSDSDGTANSVNENAATDTVVGITALASDDDATNNTITYSLDDTAGGRFKIDAASGVVTVDNGTLLDRETAASHDITVRATSSDGSFDTEVMTINVNDVDEFDVSTPTDSDAGAEEVDENTVIGTMVGVTANAFDLDATNNTITYSLISNPDGLFTIDANTGVVTTAAAIDRETHGATRSITVEAASSDGSVASQSFNITINDVDEFDVSTVTDSDATVNAVDENAASDTVVGITALASDADATNNTITYTLDDNAGGRFKIDSASGVVTVDNGTLLDRETAASHDITVRATSSDGSFNTAFMTISVNGVNDNAPVIMSNGGGASAVVLVSENTTSVTSVLAVDADLPLQSITYSIIGGADAAKFSINSSTGALAFATAPDYETPTDSGFDNTYNVTVQASDGAGGFDTQALSVTVIDNPQVYDQFNAISYAGNDGDENWLNNWTEIGESNGPSSGVVEVRSSGYMEIGGDEVSISGKGAKRAADLSGATSAILSFDYRRVNADGGGGSVSVQVSGNGGGSWTNLATYSLSSFDGSFESATFDISAYAGSNTQIRFIGSGSDISAYFRIDNVSIEHNGSISNSAPVISSDGGDYAAAIAIDENTLAVTTVTASDSDLPAQTLTYSLGGGDDAASFTINAVSGALSFLAAPNYEMPADFNADNVYEVIVQVEDGQGGFDDQLISVTINDADEFDIGPVADADGAVDYVDEDALIGTSVGITASAVDADGSNSTVTYTLDDDAGGRFAIDTASGEVTVAGALDREANVSHNITVRATSADGSFSTQVFSISLGDVDEFDVGVVNDTDGTTNEVDENATIGTTVGITASASDADATTNAITYALADDDGGRFSIDSSTGIVTVAAAIDREVDGPTRNITVRATSADSSFTDQVYAITILDIDEFDVTVPTDVDGATDEVDENVIVGTTVGITADAFDLDATNNTITYSLTSNPDGLFTIDANTGVVTTAAAIDRETHGAVRSITVQAASSDGSTASQSFNITINDLDEYDVTVPTDTDAAANAVDENVTTGTVVGLTANAFDLDATNNTITYSLTSNPDGLFTIDGNTGVVTTAAAIDRETHGATRSVTVQAASSDGSIASQSFNITINDLDEFDVGPITDSDGAADTVAENASIGTTVGITALAADADATNNAITYTLDDDAGGRFAIDGSTGEITVNAALDYESNTSHNVIVRAASSDGSFNTQGFTITVTDISEFGVTPIADNDGVADTVAENSVVGTTVGLTAFSDDADGTDTISYSLDDNDGGRFAIDSTAGIVTVAGAIDREADGATRSITVRATSTDGSFQTRVFTISIDDVDEFDVGSVTDSDATGDAVDENAANGTVVGVTALASDADATNNTITYSLDDNAGGRFTIDSSTGVVTVADGTLLDREAAASHDITVRATSSDGSFNSQLMTININDVDEFDVGAVVDSDGTANAVDENAIAGTVVGITASATDDDATTNAITYSLFDDDGGRFTVDSNSGVVTVAGAIDREADGATRNITVRATSADGSFTDQVFAININDVDEFDVGAVVDNDGTANAVDENAVAGTVVGITASASDDDATTNAITYSLFDDDGGRFNVDSNSGVVTVAGAINREADGATRNITVRATSADGSFTDQVFAININDVDEFDVGAVVDSDGTANAVDENAIAGTVVGITASATDDDATNNVITYSLPDNDGGRFSIDSGTGIVRVAGAIDRETDGTTRYVTVRATSTDGSFSEQIFAININDVDEFDVGPVTDVDNAINEVAENSAIGTAVGITASASDLDATTNAITYSLQDNDGGRFSIDSTTGSVAVAGAIDYELDGPTRNITVRATSSDGSFSDQVLAIGITDVNEAPVESTIEVAPLVYTENDFPTAVTNTLTLSDVDDTHIESATIQITGNYLSGQDVLAFTDTGSITGVWNSSTGTLTLTGSDTLANYEAALRNVTYSNTSDDPSAATRTVSFTVNDGDLDSNIQTRDISVTPINDAPVASAIESTPLVYTENDLPTAITSSITIDDLDDTLIESAVIQITSNYVNGQDVLAFTNTGTITGVWNTFSGTLTLVGSDTLANYEAALQSVTYENTSDDPSGLTRTVTFITNDGNNDSNLQTRDINVLQVNDDPVNAGMLPTDINAVEETLSDVDLSVLNLNDLDAGAGDLTVTLQTSAGGVLTATSGSGVTVAGSGSATITLTGNVVDLNAYFDLPANVQYTGPIDLTGNDADTILVEVTDNGNTGAGGGGIIGMGIVNIDLANVNDAPVAGADSVTVAEGATINIPATGVLANDSDVEGDALTATLVSGPANGSLVLNSDGSFSYTHDGGETTVDSFVYQVADGNGGFDTQTVTITVTPVNDAPVANAESYSTAEDTALVAPFDVLANDTDADGDSLTISLIDPPDHADSFAINPAGSFNYVPRPDFFGVDSFAYRVQDGNGGTDTATVTITVTPINDAPVGSTDEYSTTVENTIIAIVGVLSNDADVEGDPLTAILLSGPANGTLSLAPNGTFVYTPDPGFVGVDSFSYIPNDGMANGLATLVNVDVVVGTITDVDTNTSPLPPENDERNIELDTATEPEVNIEIVGADTPPNEEKFAGTVLKLGMISDFDGDADNIFELLADRRQAEDVLRIMLQNVHADLLDAEDLNRRVDTRFGTAFDPKYLWHDLDSLNDLQRSLFENMNISIGAITAVSTLGYIFWSLRGGVLIAAALTQMPNWRLIDPLPVLESYETKTGASKGDDMNGFFDAF